MSKVLDEIEADDERTLYVVAKPNGFYTTIDITNDGIKLYSTSDEVADLEDAIVRNTYFNSLIQNLKMMYFPIVDKVSINGYYNEGFYKPNSESISDHFILTSVKVGEDKELFPQISDSVNGLQFFKHPYILYINKISRIKELEQDYSVDNPYSEQYNTIIV